MYISVVMWIKAPSCQFSPNIILYCGLYSSTMVLLFEANFFYLEFLSQTFMIHKKAGEGEGYFFKSSVPLPPLQRHLDTSQAITVKTLHITWQPDSNREPLVSECKSLTIKLHIVAFMASVSSFCRYCLKTKILMEFKQKPLKTF